MTPFTAKVVCRAAMGGALVAVPAAAHAEATGGYGYGGLVAGAALLVAGIVAAVAVAVAALRRKGQSWGGVALTVGAVLLFVVVLIALVGVALS